MTEVNEDKFWHPDEHTEIISIDEMDAGHNVLVKADPAEAIIMTLDVSKVLDILGPRLKYVVKRRFALEGEEFAGNEELAAELGITGERVRQLTAHALQRLRTDEVAKELKAYIRE